MRREMHRGGTGRRCLVILMAFLSLAIAVPGALASELERMRERYDNKLRAHQKRITEIEAKGRGPSADPRSARMGSRGIGSPTSGPPSRVVSARPSAWWNWLRRHPVTRRNWPTCTKDSASTSTSSRVSGEPTAPSERG